MTPTMPIDTAAIEIDQLVRRYGRTDAVNGLSLRVEPGRCYGILWHGRLAPPAAGRGADTVGRESGNCRVECGDPDRRSAITHE